jgi:endonuclease YncB( thermonuclease family)
MHTFCHRSPPQCAGPAAKWKQNRSRPTKLIGRFDLETPLSVEDTMFWRKKSDGFEWHKYVRTTIKLKREDRRRRIHHAKSAAAEGLKEAGRLGLVAGTSGLERVWHAARVAAQMASAAAAAGIARFRDGARLAWYGARIVAATGAAALLAGSLRVAEISLRAMVSALSLAGDRLRPHGGVLMQPGVQVTALVVAGLAGLSAAISFGENGVGTAGAMLVLAALTALVLATLPVLLGLQAPPRALAMPLGRFGEWCGRMPPRLRAAVAGTAAVAILLSGGWMLLTGASQIVTLPHVPGLSAEVVEGRGTAVAGDVLRVREVIVRLNGIEAPLPSQRCVRPGNRRWKCGEASQEALARALRSGPVRCELRGRDEGGRALGTCTVRGKDVAASLVREGAVFAAGGLLARYRDEERQAMAERAGLWQGEAERPSEYRAKLWEAAKRTAPDECPIKGQVSSNGKYYLVPWSPNYTRAQVRTQRGERWFCSEREALAAGWKPLERG